MPGRDANEFAKNLLSSNSANEVKPAGVEAEIIACPNCGKEQERKPGAVCIKCKRLIPRQKARQGWEQKKKILYANMEQYFEKEGDEETEVKFDKSRKGPGFLYYLKRGLLLVGLCIALYVLVPALLKKYMGIAAFNNMEKNIHQSITNVPNMFKQKPAAAPKKTRRH